MAESRTKPRYTAGGGPPSFARAARRSARAVGIITGVAAYALVSNSAEGFGWLLLAGLVSVWIGGFAFFLCYECGESEEK
jgi:hypothetical protein